MANIQVLGKIGKNAEVKQIGQNTVAQFSLAENVGFGDKKLVIWYDCSLWGSQAKSNLVDYLNKGREVFICGELSTFTANDGKTYLKVNVQQIKLTSGTKDGQASQQQPQNQQQNGYNQQPQQGYQPKNGDDLDSDLPF